MSIPASRVHLVFVNFDNDTGCIHVLNSAATFSYCSSTGVDGDSVPYRYPPKSGLSARRSDAPDVACSRHQCTVGVIVFGEQDRGRTDGRPPAGWKRPCSQRGAAGTSWIRLATAVTGSYKVAFTVIRVGVRLSDNVVAFFDSRRVMNFVSNHAINARRYGDRSHIRWSVRTRDRG